MPYTDSDSDSEDALPPVVRTVRRRRVDAEDEATRKQKFTCVKCREVFDTKKDLVRHKDKANDHEYCKLHDLDFETWEDYGIHRVNSRDHKTCEHCYQDFKSQEGLELHRKQLHKGDKSNICPYCKKAFKGGMAGLTMHVETNQCKGGMTRAGMEERINARRIGLEPATDKRANQPLPAGGADVEGVASGLRTMNLTRTTSAGNDLGITPQNIKDYWNPLHGKFVCRCGKKFTQQQSMWQHVQSIAHQLKTFRCVGCQKHFGSSSALLQHQESGACKIAADDYLIAADRATGGLASAVLNVDEDDD